MRFQSTDLYLSSVECMRSSYRSIMQVDLYSGALFIQQALQWNLYWSIMALLALTVLCTLGGGIPCIP